MRGTPESPDLGHELRTPLNAVLGNAELIRAEPHGALDPRYREQVDAIIAGGRQLLAAVRLVERCLGPVPRRERRAEIRDARGRRITVVRRPIARAEEATAATAPTIVEALEALSGRVRRLTMSRRDPEHFHCERSEIARDLQQLAAAIRDG